MRSRIRSLAAIAIGASAISLPGCASSGAETGGSGEAPLVGMERQIGDLIIRLDERDGRHVVVVVAPTTGWDVRLDATAMYGDTAEVFVTAMFPRNAAGQALTPTTLRTDLPADAPLNVHVRSMAKTVNPEGSYGLLSFPPPR